MTQCLILSGGLGRRMQAHCPETPKALMQVNGVPFLHHQLTHLAREDVTHVILSIGYKGDMIRDYVGKGDKWGLRVTFVDEGDHLRGTGGAVRLAVDTVPLKGGFFVLYGDSYLPISFPPLWAASRQGNIPLMSVFENAGRFDQSNVIFKNGQITLYEKGHNDAAAIGMRYIDYGLGVLTPDTVREFIPPEKKGDLSLVYDGLVKAGRLKGFEVTTRFYEIGSPQGLAELEAYLRQDQDTNS